MSAPQLDSDRSSEEATWRLGVLRQSGAASSSTAAERTASSRPLPSFAAPTASSRSKQAVNLNSVPSPVHPDEFFEPDDQALIKRLAGSAPVAGGTTSQGAALGPGGAGEQGREPHLHQQLFWEDSFQQHLSLAIDNLFKCEETLQKRHQAGNQNSSGAEEEEELQKRLDALNTEVGSLLKTRQELESEIHDLEGDTEGSDFRIKSTGELRRLIQVFELDMATVQAELEKRIGD